MPRAKKTPQLTSDQQLGTMPETTHRGRPVGSKNKRRTRRTSTGTGIETGAGRTQRFGLSEHLDAIAAGNWPPEQIEKAISTTENRLTLLRSLQTQHARGDHAFAAGTNNR